MKILHISETLAAGVGHVLIQLGQLQQAAGHELVLVHARREDTPPEAVLARQFAGVRRVFLPMVTAMAPWQDVLSLLGLIKIVRRERPDVVHLHSSKAGILGRLAVRLAGSRARLIYSPHGFAFLRQDVSPRKQRLFLGFEQLAARLGGTLVACSASEQALAVQRVGHRRVVLIENATDLSRLASTAARDSLSLTVVSSGRACYQKAPWRFAQLATACQDLPAQFLWLGDGPLADSLRAVPGVQLSGWLPQAEVAARLAQASVFVMTSLWEGMPLALIEAQAAGLPAVVPDVIGCRDVVQDGVTGFVCADDAELADRLRQLLTDEDLRLRLGANAAREARARFSLARFGQDWEDLLRELMS